MCSPALAIAGVSLATGGLQAYSVYQEGKANASVAENNARLARSQVDAVNAQSTRDQEQQSWRTRAMLGQQRAAIASNNLDPVLGTPSEILGETAMFGEVDQQTIRNNAARQAWGYQAEAINYDNQARTARWSGRTGAAATILGSLGSAFGAAYGGARAGRPSRAQIGPVQREIVKAPPFRVTF